MDETINFGTGHPVYRSLNAPETLQFMIEKGYQATLIHLVDWETHSLKSETNFAFSHYKYWQLDTLFRYFKDNVCYSYRCSSSYLANCSYHFLWIKKANAELFIHLGQISLTAQNKLDKA